MKIKIPLNYNDEGSSNLRKKKKMSRLKLWQKIFGYNKTFTELNSNQPKSFSFFWAFIELFMACYNHLNTDRLNSTTDKIIMILFNILQELQTTINRSITNV